MSKLTNENTLDLHYQLREMTSLYEQTREAMNSNEIRFHTLAQATNNVVWIVNPTGAATFRQESWEKFTGQTWKEYQGYGWVDVIHPHDREVLLQVWNHALTTGVVYQHTARFRDKNGNYVYTYARGVPLRNDHGEITEWVGICFDITKQKETEQKLHEVTERLNLALSAADVSAWKWDISERKKAERWIRQHQLELAHMAQINTMGEIATNLAHELNQPLAAISTYTQGCLAKLESGEYELQDLAVGIKEAAKQAQRAGEIIHRIKDFSNQGKLYVERIDIEEILQEVLPLVEQEILGDGFVIELQRMACSNIILADKIQIQQVVLNLIRNSIQAMRDAKTMKPKVIISIAAQEKEVEITVQDNGPGFPENMAAKLIAPYFTTKLYGMGIGLSIARTIIEAHGGHLALQNSILGAMVVFTLPLYKEGN